MRPENKDEVAAAAKVAADLSKKKRKMAAAFHFVTTKVKEATSPSRAEENSDASP